MLIGFTGLLAALLVGAYGSGFFDRGGGTQQSPNLGAIPAVYDAGRSMRYLNLICDIGPRASGSEGMRRQQTMLQGFSPAKGRPWRCSLLKFDIPKTGPRCRWRI